MREQLNTGGQKGRENITKNQTHSGCSQSKCPSSAHLCSHEKLARRRKIHQRSIPCRPRADLEPPKELGSGLGLGSGWSYASYFCLFRPLRMLATIALHFLVEKKLYIPGPTFKVVFDLYTGRGAIHISLYNDYGSPSPSTIYLVILKYIYYTYQISHVLPGTWYSICTIQIYICTYVYTCTQM